MAAASANTTLKIDQSMTSRSRRQKARSRVESEGAHYVDQPRGSDQGLAFRLALVRWSAPSNPPSPLGSSIAQHTHLNRDRSFHKRHERGFYPVVGDVCS